MTNNYKQLLKSWTKFNYDFYVNDVCCKCTYMCFHAVFIDGKYKKQMCGNEIYKLLMEKIKTKQLTIKNNSLFQHIIHSANIYKIVHNITDNYICYDESIFKQYIIKESIKICDNFYVNHMCMQSDPCKHSVLIDDKYIEYMSSYKIYDELMNRIQNDNTLKIKYNKVKHFFDLNACLYNNIPIRHKIKNNIIVYDKKIHDSSIIKINNIKKEIECELDNKYENELINLLKVEKTSICKRWLNKFFT